MLPVFLSTCTCCLLQCKLKARNLHRSLEVGLCKGQTLTVLAMMRPFLITMAPSQPVHKLDHMAFNRPAAGEAGRQKLVTCCFGSSFGFASWRAHVNCHLSNCCPLTASYDSLCRNLTKTTGRELGTAKVAKQVQDAVAKQTRKLSFRLQ